MDEIFDVIKAVISDKNVIAAAVACALAFEFIRYISNYRKKPPKQKFKRAAVSVPQPASEGSENSASEDGAGE